MAPIVQSFLGGPALEEVRAAVVAGRFLHFEVQLLAGVGMGAGEVLVEVDAEAGFGRHDHVAVVPADRIADQLQVEGAAGLDRLDHEEVRDRSAEMDVGRPLDRPGVEMGCDLRCEGFGDDGDLLALPDAARAAEGRLEDAGTAGPEHGGKLRLGGEALARGYRNPHRLLHLGEVEEVVGRDRLLVPQGAIGFDRLGEPYGARDVELAVGAEKEVGPVAHRLADRPAEGDRTGDVRLAWVVPAADRVGAGGVEFHRGEAHTDETRRGFCRHVGADPECGALLSGLGI